MVDATGCYSCSGHYHTARIHVPGKQASGQPLRPQPESCSCERVGTIEGQNADWTDWTDHINLSNPSDATSPARATAGHP